MSQQSQLEQCLRCAGLAAAPSASAPLVALVTDELGGDGSWLLHLLLQRWLGDAAAPRRACVLSLEQPYGHWHAVAQRLGCGWAEARRAGKLAFIDGLSAPVAWGGGAAAEGAGEAEEEAPLPPQSVVAGPAVEDPFAAAAIDTRRFRRYTPREGALDELRDWVAAWLAEDDAPCLVVVDSTTLLLEQASGGAAEGAEFLASLRAMSPALLLALGHADCEVQGSGFGGTNGANTNELAALQHEADVTLAVRALRSGHSALVHGELSVEPALWAMQMAGGGGGGGASCRGGEEEGGASGAREASAAQRSAAGAGGATRRAKFHYRVTETAIKVFIPGSAEAM